MTPPQFPADPQPTSPATATESGVPAPTLTIDAMGRKCPIPIIMLAERIREVPVGHVVAVLADDPAAATDIPAWCRLKGQEFLSAEQVDGDTQYLVRKTG